MLPAADNRKVQLLSKPDLIPILLWERGCLCSNEEETILVDMILPEEVANFQDLNINVLASHEDIVAGNDGATYLRVEVHTKPELCDSIEPALAQWCHECFQNVMQLWYAPSSLSVAEPLQPGAASGMLSVKEPAGLHDDGDD